MKRAFTFFFCVLCLYLFSLPHGALAAVAGKITHVEGRVDVLKAGKKMATPLSLGDTVDVGDIYRAKGGSRAEITFVNRNLLRIAPNSRVEIKEYMVERDRSSGIVRLHRGKVQAVAAEELVKRVAAFAEGNRFEVHTQNAVAGIRGTNMLVGFERGATTVIFLAGQGYLYNPARPDVITPISAGTMSLVATPLASPTQPQPASDARINSFIQQVTPVVTSQTFPGTVTAVDAAASVDPAKSLAIFAAPSTGSGSQISQFSGGINYVQQQTQQQQQLQQQQTQQQQQLQQQQTSPALSELPQTPLTFGWIDRPPPSSHWGPKGVAYGNGKYVAGGYYGWAVSSIDGFTWTPVVSTGGNRVVGGTFGNGLFVLVGDGGSIVTSPDGVNWTRRSGTTQNFNGAVYGNGTFVVVGESGGNGAIVYSTNGVNWTAATVPTTPGGFGPPAYGNGKFVVVGGANILTSADGSTWTAVSSGTTQSLWAVAYGNGKFVAVGGTVGVTGVLYTSSDGVTWTLQPSATLQGENLSRVAYGNNTFVATGFSRTILTSRDGITWTPQTTGVTDCCWGVAFGDGGFLSVGGESRILAGIPTSLYNALSLSTWNSQSLAFSSAFLNSSGTNALTSFASFNGTVLISSGWISSLLMGSTASLFGGPNNSVKLFGTYQQPPQTGGIWGLYGPDMVIAYNSGAGTYTTYDSSPRGFKGYLVGTFASDNSMEGRLIGYYVDSSGNGGFIKGSLSGSAYADSTMFGLNGQTIAPVQMASGISFSANAFSPGTPDGVHDASGYYTNDTTSIYSGSFSGGGSINIGSIHSGGAVYSAGISNQDWGIWKSPIGSTFTGTTSDNWQMTMDFMTAPAGSVVSILGNEITGSQWSGGKIAGQATGYGADIQSTPKTWVTVADVVGTFNPGDSRFQMITAGPWIETNKFLAMAADTTAGGGQAKLGQLSFPAVEVGMVDLKGSWSSAGNTIDMSSGSYGMTNVKFFAPLSGGKPQIWATGTVSGAYSFPSTGDPKDKTVALTGPGGMSASFTFYQWSSNKWLAAVTPPTTTPNAPGGIGSWTQPITFRGAGAGTSTGSSTSGTFAGTAAGVAK